jgi:exopolyphosphatase/guanosine-5'-triphosphate,3'-diphosphate pyrophosphatase
MKLLIFDIGSNSVRTAKLSDEDDLDLTIKNKRVYTTRLAEGLAESGTLSQARMRQSLFVIRSILQDACSHGFDCYAYATSAVRDAGNGLDFVRDVEEMIGIGRVRVLSGSEEAGFAQRGSDPSGKRTILDIGGGSTQIVRAGSHESWPIGCVRAKDLAPYDDLDSIAESLRPALSGLFGMPEREERPDKKNLPGSRMSEKNAPLGVGGTITTLALLCEGATSFSEWRGEKEIPLLELCTTLQALSQMGDEARASIPLLKDRHDVILQGGVILLYLMELLHTTRIDATLSDGLDGYAMHLYHTLLHD